MSENGKNTSLVEGKPGLPMKWHALNRKSKLPSRLVEVMEEAEKLEANELATIFRSNDLGPIIGITSGGGACSITPILLPNGTAFTMSSNNIQAYRTGTGTVEDPYVFHDTEFGVIPDFELESFAATSSPALIALPKVHLERLEYLSASELQQLLQNLNLTHTKYHQNL